MADREVPAATLVFYEAPHRLPAALEALAAAFGADRELAFLSFFYGESHRTPPPWGSI